jgi:hypothetical protein
MTFPLSISSSIFSLLTSRGVELLRPLPVQSGGSPRLHPITNELRTQRFTISATSLALAKKSDSTASPVRTASQTAHAERNEAPTALVVVLRPRSVGVVLQRKEPDFPRLFCSVMLIAKSSGYSRARTTTSTTRSPQFRSLGLSGGTTIRPRVLDKTPLNGEQCTLAPRGQTACPERALSKDPQLAISVFTKAS